MIRLRRIEITGFRGILDLLPIDFGPKCHSIAMFGENATGKSSIADAVEWFYTDRINHLWKENCKETALRNTLLPEKASSTVTLRFNSGIGDCSKVLSPSLGTSLSNKSMEFAAYVQGMQNGQERLILRNWDLLSFVVSTKSEKRQYLARIIGYQALDDFRAVLTLTQTRLEGTPEYVTVGRMRPQYQADIFKIAGDVISTDKGLFEAGQRLASRAGLSLTIPDDDAYTSAISEISRRIGESDKAARQLVMGDAKQKCDTLTIKVIAANESVTTFSIIYAELIRSEEQLRQIKLEAFLSLGRKAIDDALTLIDACPLCLLPRSWDSLREEIQARIEKLEESKERYNSAFKQMSSTVASLLEAAGAGQALVNVDAKAEMNPAFVQMVRNFRQRVTMLAQQIGREFDNFRPISADLGSVVPIVAAKAEEESERLKQRIESLKLSEQEQKLLDLVGNMTNLRTAFRRYLGASKTVQMFDRQITTISAIRSAFNKVHASTLQVILDRMSEDIGQYYLAMHPAENVDAIKLTVLDEGVEFEYAFHGKRVYPPLKYLSESHLNSLGIAAFLASAKLFNKLNEFLILDDIVTSFDSNHRLRLLRLLKEKFADWQILLLTHEPFWFEMIKKELVPEGWLILELEVVAGTRVQAKSSARTLKEEVIRKQTNGTLTPNELRTAFERILKEIGRSLEVKMAFRFNDENERRMPWEMLSELRTTLKKHSPTILAEPIFSRLGVSNFIVTTGSHDSGPLISPGDVKASSEDILNLDATFFCEQCGHYVSVEKLVAHEGRICCRCGKKQLDWKD